MEPSTSTNIPLSFKKKKRPQGISTTASTKRSPSPINEESTALDQTTR